MQFRTLVILLCCSAWMTTVARSQDQASWVAQRPPDVNRAPQMSSFVLPPQRGEPGSILESGSDLPFPGEMVIDKPNVDYKSLLKPRFGLGFEWEPESGGLGMYSYDVSMKLPTYPFFGPPPPIITTGYSFTQMISTEALDLPQNFHEASLGLAWMRRINRRWLARFMISTAYASDLENNSRDAWQLRGGGFGIYRPNDRWSFAVGALATGRSDIPVLPAAGLIFQPSDRLKINLMMPEPRISWCLEQREQKQLWGYVGGGINGGNWAFERSDQTSDQLNYREWRIVAGWEVTPVQEPGVFRPVGQTFQFEIGLALGREINFKTDLPDIALGNALLIRTGVRF